MLFKIPQLTRHSCASRCDVLDEIGDKSKPAERLKQFRKYDKDGWAAIGFEEYLNVRDYHKLPMSIFRIEL